MGFVKKYIYMNLKKEVSHMNESSKMKPIHYKSMPDVTTGQ